MIKIILIAAGIVICALLALIALALLALGIAADVMQRQEEWTDEENRKDKGK